MMSDAQKNGTGSEQASNADAKTTNAENPGTDVEGEASQEAPAVEDTLLKLTISLPRTEEKIPMNVSSHEQVHEIRQSIVEMPPALQYSCFHLEHQGTRVNDFVQISEIDGIAANPELQVVEDPYTEKDARIHVYRVRELIGAAGDRTDTVQGLLAGSSLFDMVAPDDASEDEVGEYDFHAPPSTSVILPPESDPAPKTVKALSLSPWNPPPAPLRQKGHLLYLIVTTNEGEQHQITAHVGGFFVNKSSNTKFDPFPRAAPKAHAAHSLLTLIEDISPSFAATFRELQDFNGRRDALSTFQLGNSIPSAPWLVPPFSSRLVAHSPDITRTQEAFLIAGAENTDTLRDWNEEFQSAKEMPKESVQDRVFRERLVSKLFADYTEAATRGAVLVARGEVAPLNPTEGKDAQIFVYNNIFYSFGADGVGTFTSEGGDEAARVATGKDVHGVKLVNQLDIESLHTPGTVVVDYLGKRIVAQSIVPGIFKQPEPGESQIHYGAVDGREVVAADDRFTDVFQKLAQALKIKKHPVWDKEGKKFDLETSVEMKGLLGTDGRRYVLDLYRITPLDIAWLEEKPRSEELSYPHRMTVLRPELVESLAKSKMREWVNAEVAKRAKDTKTKAASDAEGTTELTTKDAKADVPATEADSESGEENASNDKEGRIDVSEFKFALNPDGFSDLAPITDEEKEAVRSDEDEVRVAGTYLRETVIPAFLQDLKDSDLSFPIDGRALSKVMHRRGINIRYLGKLATLAEGSRLACLRQLCVREMIARSFKHVAVHYLRHLPLPLTSACLAHLLNCLLGTGLNPKPVADVDESLKQIYDDADLAFEAASPASLRKAIEQEAQKRYRFDLPEDWHTDISHLQLLREVSLKLGLQLQSRTFAFGAETDSKTEAKAGTDKPVTNGVANGEGKKKRKKARDGSPASIASSATASHTFNPDDIVNIVPLVKDSSPQSALAEEALDAGRISIMQNQKKLGEELLLESLSLHEQIYGMLHPEVASVYHSLSQIYYTLDQKEAAVELARKAVIVSERTVGIDASETILDYLNLSLFLHQNGDSKTALRYTKHALGLWKLAYGPDHPDTITTINNAAVMLQHLKAYHESRRWFEESLRICEGVYGKNSVNSATLLFQLAQALALDQDSKAAVGRMRESYNIFLAELGPKDKNTKEAESWLEQLTQNAVSIAKHNKDMQARRIRAGIKFTPRDVSMGSPSTAAPGLSSAAKPTGIDSRSIDDLIRFIEGTDKQTSKNAKKRPGRSNPRRRGGDAVGTTA